MSVTLAELDTLIAAAKAANPPPARGEAFLLAIDPHWSGEELEAIAEANGITIYRLPPEHEGEK